MLNPFLLHPRMIWHEIDSTTADAFTLFLKGPTLTKEDKESLRQKELKQMKAKYGLQVSVKEAAAAWPMNTRFCHTSSHPCAFLYTEQWGDQSCEER